jgi:hypothetical protein
MIINTIFRMLWVTIALMLAVGAALAVLFALGAMWVGDELRAASPNDPMLQHGADRIFGIVLFAGTVTPALTILPRLPQSLPARYCASAPGCSTCLPAARLSSPYRSSFRRRAPTTFSRFRPAPICRSLLPRVSSAVSSIGCLQARGPD